MGLFGQRKNIPKLPVRSSRSRRKDFGPCGLLCLDAYKSSHAELVGRAMLLAGVSDVELVVEYSIGNKPVAAFDPLLNVHQLTNLHTDPKKEVLVKSKCICVGPWVDKKNRLILDKVQTDFPNPMVIDSEALISLDLKSIVSPGGPRIYLVSRRHIRNKFMKDSRQELLRDEDLRVGVDRLARSAQAIVVMKGQNTYVTSGVPGLQCHISNIGNAGMWTSRIGDILGGIIAAFVAQNISPYEAAVLGVHVLNIAADMAVCEVGMESLLCYHVIDHLPNAMQTLKRLRPVKKYKYI